jgi:hypothetical protein
MTSLWSLLADLPLTVGHVESEQLSAAYAEMTRVTTIIRLVGLDGQDGLGEEIGGPERTPHDQLAELVPTLPLAGEWTLASFCAHVGALDLWPEAPAWEVARNFRQWVFESAALDLALRQDGRSLAQALGRSLAPVRFVSSLGLGDPPTLEGVHRRLDADPTLRVKVDAERTWPRPLMEELAATDAAVTIDFKGQYGLPVGTTEEMAALYDGVLACFPDALLEDPHDLPGIGEKLRAVRERVSYDAPVTSVESLCSLPVEPGWVNVKPSHRVAADAVFHLRALRRCWPADVRRRHGRTRRGPPPGPAACLAVSPRCTQRRRPKQLQPSPTSPTTCRVARSCCQSNTDSARPFEHARIE